MALPGLLLGLIFLVAHDVVYLMYQADFSGCRAKFYRAIEHRNALQTHVVKHIVAEGNRPTIGIKFKPETGEHAVYVSLCPEYGPHLERCSILLSDAIQNLRASLDYLTFQLAMRNKDGVLDNERRVQFPIEDDPTVFKTRCEATGARDRRGWIAELAADDQKILERYQPYHGKEGDPAAEDQVRTCGSNCSFLYILRDISDPDNHRLPQPVLIPPVRLDKVDPAVAMIMEGHMRRQRDTGERSLPITIEAGTEICWCKMPGWPETDMDMAGHVTPLVAIQVGQLFQVVPTLDQTARIVRLLLGEFDTTLGAMRLTIRDASTVKG